MHNIESRCAIGPENILFAGASVYLWPLKILQAGTVKGLTEPDFFVAVFLCVLALRPQPQDLSQWVATDAEADRVCGLRCTANPVRPYMRQDEGPVQTPSTCLQHPLKESAGRRCFESVGPVFTS